MKSVMKEWFQSTSRISYFYTSHGDQLTQHGVLLQQLTFDKQLLMTLIWRIKKKKSQNINLIKSVYLRNIQVIQGQEHSFFGMPLVCGGKMHHNLLSSIATD